MRLASVIIGRSKRPSTGSVRYVHSHLTANFIQVININQKSFLLVIPDFSPNSRLLSAQTVSDVLLLSESDLMKSSTFGVQLNN